MLEAMNVLERVQASEMIKFEELLQLFPSQSKALRYRSK
jgi:hypothetical protein